ncbi:MAG: alpha-amylase family glycosyl hydrolase, partial [candidate division KSB1 bacterium]|nr:alpha-amylase family glycosyl hydrolase [candidate division KSB1 bacterium]
MRKIPILCLIGLIVIGNCRSLKKDMVPTVPLWAKQAIWYQIFPERFWNGDKNNDPTLLDLVGGWPHHQPSQWQIHPWTSDWYKLQPWEETYQKDFYWCAGLRRYGGDLQGILDRLDYLQELGINAIYLNPIFEAPSLHKYDATMYHHIDNNFGPDPETDRAIWASENPADPGTWRWTTADSLFLKLIESCHQRGIKVIIDGVFNHVGLTFWAFQDVMKNQQASAYKDWFTIKRWDDPNTPENEFDYEGWYGVKDLPELKEDQNGLVTGPREHIRAIVQRWLDPNGDGDPSEGIDGWRLDVAEKVNIAFWRDFRKWVKAINPEAYITGEIWWEDWPNNRMMNAKPWLQGDAFDGVMNYRVARAIKQFLID